jgi:hypothetical protein
VRLIRTAHGILMDLRQLFALERANVGRRAPIRGPLPLLGLLVSLRRMFQVGVSRRETGFPVSALCCSQFNGGARSSILSY